MAVKGTARKVMWKGTVGGHVRVYRWTNGKIGGSMRGASILLLTTTGRRSGQPRTTPLLFLRKGDAYVVVASNGGLDTHPSWYVNLRANPEAEIRIGSERVRVRARVAPAEERAELWTRIVERNAGYETYQRKTSREIPVVVLERAGT